MWHGKLQRCRRKDPKKSYFCASAPLRLDRLYIEKCDSDKRTEVRVTDGPRESQKKGWFSSPS